MILINAIIKDSEFLEKYNAFYKSFNDIQDASQNDSDIQDGSQNKLYHHFNKWSIARVITHFHLTKEGFCFFWNGHNSNNLLIKQIYFFIKYSVHKHHHHSSQSDSISTIFPITKENKNNMGQSLIRELFCGMADIRRSLDDLHYIDVQNSKGILGYTKSLILSCKIYGIISEAEAKHQSEYLENLAESLVVCGKQEELRLKRKKDVLDDIRLILLTVMAVIGPIVIVFGKSIECCNKNSFFILFPEILLIMR